MPAKTEETAETLKPGHVWCRITKKGHDKVFKGITVPNPGAEGEQYSGPNVFPRFDYGEIIQLPLKVAEAQEENGFAEIQED